MKHQGSLVEKLVRESGVPITEIAKRTGFSRGHIYNMFHQPKLRIDFLLEVGKVIHVDFSVLIEQNHKLVSSSSLSESKEMNWKEKYLILLEKYNQLLEKGVEDFILKRSK